CEKFADQRFVDVDNGKRGRRHLQYSSISPGSFEHCLQRIESAHTQIRTPFRIEFRLTAPTPEICDRHHQPAVSFAKVTARMSQLAKAAVLPQFQAESRSFGGR